MINFNFDISFPLNNFAEVFIIKRKIPFTKLTWELNVSRCDSIFGICCGMCPFHYKNWSNKFYFSIGIFTYDFEFSIGKK